MEPKRTWTFVAVAGAQLIARSRFDLLLYDSPIDSYRAAGPIGTGSNPVVQARLTNGASFDEHWKLLSVLHWDRVSPAIEGAISTGSADARFEELPL